MKKLSKLKSRKQYNSEGLIDAKEFIPNDDRIVLVCCERGIYATAQVVKGKWIIQEDFAKLLVVKWWTDERFN